MELVMERIKVFENYLEYGKKIKELLEKHLSFFELFIFGLVVKGNFFHWFERYRCCCGL